MGMDAIFGERFTPEEYPYDANDGRENLDAGRDVRRVLRGGAFDDTTWGVRCAYRYGAPLTQAQRPRVSGSGVLA